VGADEAGPHAKLSISVPTTLLAAVREVAETSGGTVSGVITAALRRVVDEAEQARLDAALEADREENLEWARATAPADAALAGGLEW
jgi:fructose-1,6-bisphosphatase/sedoheptulose 1,7-bisphosphatase-like protein